jgi:hypothetical protein
MLNRTLWHTMLNRTLWHTMLNLTLWQTMLNRNLWQTMLNRTLWHTMLNFPCSLDTYSLSHAIYSPQIVSGVKGRTQTISLPRL